MEPEDDDRTEDRPPGSSALILIGLIGLLVIVGFLYTAATK